MARLAQVDGRRLARSELGDRLGTNVGLIKLPGTTEHGAKGNQRSYIRSTPMKMS